METFISISWRVIVCFLALLFIEAAGTLGTIFNFREYNALAWVVQGCLVYLCFVFGYKWYLDTNK